MGLISLASCVQRETNLYDPEAVHLRDVNTNASKYFDNIDPNQDWSSVVSGKVTITADAPLQNVARVVIITGSPVLNGDVQLLAEADVQKGQTVMLSYDAPNDCSRLVAACIDTKGHYYMKAFNVGESTLSFASAKARTRAATRAGGSYPDVSAIKLETKNKELSYNALRTRFVNEAAATGDPVMQSVVTQGNIGAWKNAGWENETLWKPTDNSKTGTEWEIRNQAIVRTIENITDEEKATLNDLFGDFLQRTDNSQHWKRKDNRELIRNSDAVKFYDNHLTSDGTTPITIMPISMGSSEINSCHIYYYYYNPSDIPSGTTVEQYIKDLPKFKAIQCSYTMSAAKTNGYDLAGLFKVHEYLLPYYGTPASFKPVQQHSNTFCTTDGKLYRIRNGRQLNSEDYYMVYTGNDDKKLATKYADDASDLKNQLWQVFTTADGNKMLYNVGAKMFLVWEGQWATTYSADINVVQACYYKFDDENHIWRYNSQQGLGTDLTLKDSKRISTNKNTSIGANFEWFFEEYTGPSTVQAISDFVFETYPAATVTAQSLAIPKGYRIGFMLRKLKDMSTYVQNYRNITDVGHGCCYAFGGLNREINNLPGHFGSGKTYFTMEDDDPRACYFMANGKTYIGFEDGSDCQFNDIVLEVGGYDKNVIIEPPVGTEDKGTGLDEDYLYDTTEIEGQSYTLCFEDRSTSADYDMNDVVLRCKRINTTSKYKNWVQLSLVAAGGTDVVKIHIGKKCVRGDELDGKEVHELFFVDEEEGNNRFVNTMAGKDIFEPITAYYQLDEGVTIPMFLSQIYIENVSTGETIAVAKKGAAPLGIIVPYDFDYPLETRSIVYAYTTFKEWASSASQYPGWYKNEDEALVYPAQTVIEKIQQLK